jgi:molybdate transport system ATP-binding protein
MQALEITCGIRFDDFTLDLSHKFSLEGITALFGPSGCGKTTLLRVIAGFERGAMARVAYAGETWQDEDAFVPPHERGVGFVFQDTRLFPHLTVRGNLAYAEKRSRDKGNRIGFDDVISALDLGRLIERRPGSLSGGERQRVAIGRALLTRPRLLLMDEPLAALDFRRKAGIFPYVERLPASFGVPVIYVTHAIEEVTRLADQMVVLADGGKLTHGAVADVLERRDMQQIIGRFEAGVVIEAVVAGHDKKFKLTRFKCGRARITMPHADLPVDTPVRLRVRARDVALAIAKPADTSIRNILRGKIVEIFEESDTAFAETLIDIGGARLRSRITRKSVADLKLAPGKKVFALLRTVSFDRRALPHEPDLALKVDGAPTRQGD